MKRTLPVGSVTVYETVTCRRLVDDGLDLRRDVDLAARVGERAGWW